MTKIKTIVVTYYKLDIVNKTCGIVFQFQNKDLFICKNYKQVK